MLVITEKCKSVRYPDPTEASHQYCMLQAAAVRRDLNDMVFVLGGLPEPVSAELLRTGMSAGYSMCDFMFG